MKRRNFLQAGIITSIAGATYFLARGPMEKKFKERGRAKNIIFLVSDGMSSGTLTMADLLLLRKEGRMSNWMQLYHEDKVTRSLMNMASEDSLVTDSAAASSAWGGGIRVKNGTLNMNEDGTSNIPILQKFKNAGKAVGCVTTVPITHATPAGFCISSKSRGNQEEIASLYLQLSFDVMMGGGIEFFSDSKRKDGKDLLGEYRNKGYQVAIQKEEMEKALPGRPLLGVFSEDALPYALDHQSDKLLMEKVPTLASMTKKAIELMQNNSNGFVLQVEGGKVDWAAHANDASALLYDQIAFDEAIGVALEYAEKDKDTLVIITTDHGNSNPGLIKDPNVDRMFDTLLNYRQTNDWVLYGIEKNFQTNQVIDRVQKAQNILLTNTEAKSILEDYTSQNSDGLYNAYKLPFRKLAQIQQNHTSIGWSGMDHTADYVELAMFGPGSGLLSPYIKNTDLHKIMLEAAGLE
jgi:alkaline phosphatase